MKVYYKFHPRLIYIYNSQFDIFRQSNTLLLIIKWT
jgi:hypothetical protein